MSPPGSRNQLSKQQVLSGGSSINELVKLKSNVISLDSLSNVTSKTSQEGLTGIPHGIRHENKRSEQEIELNRIQNDIKRLQRK